MKIREEMRTFSNDAFELSTKLIAKVDEVAFDTIPQAQAAADIDRLARDLAAVADTLKDLAYRLGRGEERVSTVPVAAPSSVDPVIARMREYALKRVDLFTNKARTSANDFEIEANFYALAQAAEKAHRDMHKQNSTVPS